MIKFSIHNFYSLMQNGKCVLEFYWGIDTSKVWNQLFFSYFTWLAFDFLLVFFFFNLLIIYRNVCRLQMFSKCVSMCTSCISDSIGFFWSIAIKNAHISLIYLCNIVHTQIKSVFEYFSWMRERVRMILARIATTTTKKNITLCAHMWMCFYVWY